MQHPDHAMLPDDAEGWFARLRASPQDAATRDAFLRWQQSSPENAQAFAEVQDLWSGLDALSLDPDLATLLPSANDAAPVRATPAAVVQRNRRRLIGVAAAIASCAVGMALWNGRMQPAPAWQLYQTAQGQTGTWTLEDGSTLTLDVASRLQARMHGSHRELELLDGVALLDVERDSARPMRVQMDRAHVEILGTTLQLRRDANANEVTLFTGKLKVVGHAPHREEILQPGQSVRVDARQWQSRVLKATQLEAATAWREGRVVFDATTLVDVVDQLNRRGPRRIVLEDAALGQLQVSGTLQPGQQESFVRGLSRVLPIQATVGQDTVVISAQ